MLITWENGNCSPGSLLVDFIESPRPIVWILVVTNLVEDGLYILGRVLCKNKQ